MRSTLPASAGKPIQRYRASKIRNVHARAMAKDPGSIAQPEISCPFTSVKSILAPSQSASPSLEKTESPVPPGPPAFGLESAIDVIQILLLGLHGAMLRFEQKWGSTCRFANPSELNGASSWVFINSPENIQHVCLNNVRNYQRRYLPDVYEFATNGKGILASQDEYNKRHRRMCQPPFQSKNLLKGFSTVVTNRSTMASDCLREAVSTATSNGSELTVDIALHTQRLTLDIVGLTAFSHDFKQVAYMRQELQGKKLADSEQDRLLWAINTFGEVLAEVFITPLPILKILDKLGFQGLKRLAKANAVMQESMLAVVTTRRQEIESGLEGHDDLLKVLLDARDPNDGRPLTDEELCEDIHDVMGAGHETTATTTAATIYCIAAHPQVEARVRAEMQAVCGDNTPGYEDLQHMPYLQQVVKEVLRIYPAIPVFPREASDDDVLASGHAIDAGDVVFMSSYALGRSPLIWDDPLQFNPDRFSPENSESMHRCQWMPFGGGPRMCLGASFAQMSVALMTTSLMRDLKFRCLDGAPQLIDVGYDITMNFQPTKGLHMHCEAL